MSKFSTFIPVAIGRVKAALPPRSFVHSVKLVDGGVEMIWENDDLKTPWTFPTDYPLEKLGVSLATETTGESEKPVDKKRKRVQ